MNLFSQTASTVTVIVALAAAFSVSAATENGTTYSLVFPSITFDANLNQAIEEVNFTVACGHIEAVARIPDLWNVEIRRAVSAVEEFHSSAGLGAARIAEPKQWSSSITISETERSCFDLSGSIIVGGKEPFEVPLTKANLRKVGKRKCSANGVSP